MLYDPTPPRPPRRRRPQIPGRTPRSAWPVVGIAAVLLAVAAFFGAMGLAAWILVTGFLLLLTGLYALALHRQSWAGLDTDTQRKVALAGSGVVLAVGAVAATIAAPTLEQEQPTAQAEAAVPPQPEPGPTQRGELLERAPSPQVDVDPPTTPAPRTAAGRPPAAAETSLMNRPCPREGAARTQGQTAYRCTRDLDGQLVWMDRDSADRITAARAATERLNREAAAANAESERLRELDAQHQAAQQQAAAEQAAAEQAAAENARIAAEQAEALRQAEAKRLVEEQAGQPPVPTPPDTPAPTPTPVPTMPPEPTTPPTSPTPQPPTPPVPTPSVPTPPVPTPGPSLAPVPVPVPVPVPTVPVTPERAGLSASTQSP